MQREAVGTEHNGEPAWTDDAIAFDAIAMREKAEQRLREGKIVVHKLDRPLQRRVPGDSRYYVSRWIEDTVPTEWHVFTKELRMRSGRHTHQGGLVIYVVKGQGYTMVDGVRHDWKAGDLLLLPIKPGGVDHQHFNLDESGPSVWCAFIYLPFMEALGPQWEQSEAGPEWTGTPEVLPETSDHGF